MFELYPYHDVPRVRLLPLPESAVFDAPKSHALSAAYYIGDDEVLTDDDTSEMEAYAHRQWLLDGDGIDLD